MIRKFAALAITLSVLMFPVVTFTGVRADDAKVTLENSTGGRNEKLSVDLIHSGGEYKTVIYDSDDGLASSEANSIAETSDGFIWVGGYSGLARYDGADFETIELPPDLLSINALYVDSKDRLWIATNTGGVALMVNDGFTVWNDVSGLRSESVRDVIEDDSGLIYVATTSGIAVIDGDMDLTVIDDERLVDCFVQNFRKDNYGRIYALTNSGEIFMLRDGKVEQYLRVEDPRISVVNCILPDPEDEGYLYIGTAQGAVFRGNYDGGLEESELLYTSKLMTGVNAWNILTASYSCAHRTVSAWSTVTRCMFRPTYRYTAILWAT
ncbi:Two component regulator propeller [Ruminococcaceae bacterium YRB3002]|nr:Two component regulator propeller [Ruminococcaceae bacterium YRB3002]